MKTSQLKSLATAVTALAVLGSLVETTNAAYMPVGVQQNVPVATVTGGGWAVAYSGTYNTFDVSIASIFAAVPAGSYVMYAAKPVGAANFTLLAAALESDVRTQTALNATTTANGAQWYYNGYSMGFAGLGDTINQTTADTFGLGESDRLSWHTSAFAGPFYNQNSGMLPVEMEGGWRAGTTTGLNFNANWERYVLFAPVPEPSTYVAGALLLLPFGFSTYRKLRSRKSAA